MIRNLTRDTVVAHHPRLADSLGWRLRGMIGRRFAEFDALVFPRCDAIHTLFMGQAIDVAFLDREARVLRLCRALRPWRFAGAWRGATVVELPPGALAAAATAPGDRFSLPWPL